MTRLEVPGCGKLLLLGAVFFESIKNSSDRRNLNDGIQTMSRRNIYSLVQKIMQFTVDKLLYN